MSKLGRISFALLSKAAVLVGLLTVASLLVSVVALDNQFHQLAAERDPSITYGWPYGWVDQSYSDVLSVIPGALFGDVVFYSLAVTLGLLFWRRSKSSKLGWKQAAPGVGRINSVAFWLTVPLAVVMLVASLLFVRTRPTDSYGNCANPSLMIAQDANCGPDHIYQRGYPFVALEDDEIIASGAVYDFAVYFGISAALMVLLGHELNRRKR